jgi:hypothetical protein
MTSKHSPTYIPDNHCSFLPFNPSLEILTLGDMVIEEVEEKIAFFLLVAYNFTSNFIMLESFG